MILTFVTGLAIGMYVYVAAFKPVYAPEGLGGSEAAASDFSIIGKTYGGSEDAGFIRPSFRILGDGTYMYIQGGDGINALEPIQGSLPNSLVRELKAEIADSNLSHLSVTAVKGNCLSYSGGFDFEYKITVNSKQYVLDTCKTVFENNDPLAELLQSVWDELSGNKSSTTYNGSLSNMAEEWLYNRLHSSE